MGCKTGKILRNINKAMLYLCVQELALKAERHFLCFYGDGNIYTVSNSSFCDYY